MMLSLLRKFGRDRRGVTALVLALIFVPMVIAASAAVDFARIQSARALMQAAVTGATAAGANSYQLSENNTTSLDSTATTLTAGQGNLSSFVTNINTNYAVFCSPEGSAVQCGGSNYIGVESPASLYAQCPTTFITQDEYCVVATMTATLKNSLFAWLIPSDTLSVFSVNTTYFPPYTVNGKNIPPSPGFGSAGDKSSIYAYGTQMFGSSGTLPVPNFSTASNNSGVYTSGSPGTPALSAPPSTAGCLDAGGQLPLLGGTTGTSGCQYLYINDSLGDQGSGGSITLQNDQPIAFLFVNYTGANNYTQINGTHYTTQLVRYDSNGNNPTYMQTGGINYDSVTVTTTTCSHFNKDGSCRNNDSSTTSNTTTNSNTYGSSSETVCTQYDQNGNCSSSTTTVTTKESTTLYGECPDHTLYGSISQGYGAPVSDSLNVFSSAYEAEGYPPSQFANHVLTPFISSYRIQEFAGVNYYVAAICPNYPIPTDTSGTDTFGAAMLSNYPTQSVSGLNTLGGNTLTNGPVSGLNIFATWFPLNSSNEVAYTDSATSGSYDYDGTKLTSGVNDTFPPAIGGCTPATSALDGGLTPVADDPWWGWLGSNINSGHCANQQTANYNDCAFAIQPLGTSVPHDSNGNALLPDYYLIIEDANYNVVALDPVYDHTTYTDALTGTSVDNTKAPAGYVPTGSPSNPVHITNSLTLEPLPYSSSAYFANSNYVNGKLSGGPFYIVTEPPATSGIGQDHNLPESTSFQCYDPSVATSTSGGYKYNSSTYYLQSSNAVNTTSQDNGYLTNGQYETQGTVLPGYSSEGFPLDPITNPQDGAVLCDQPNPETYALYWNDMGTYESDDLGYWNAVEGFTCSTPAQTNAGGGPSTSG